MAFTLTPEQIQAALDGHDLHTYKGWIAAALALLATAPDWTAIEELNGACYVVKVALEDKVYIFAAPGHVDPEHVFKEDDLSNFDSSAWADDRGCWDGVDCAESNVKTLTEPVFVALKH